MSRSGTGDGGTEYAEFLATPDASRRGQAAGTEGTEIEFLASSLAWRKFRLEAVRMIFWLEDLAGDSEKKAEG